MSAQMTKIHAYPFIRLQSIIAEGKSVASDACNFEKPKSKRLQEGHCSRTCIELG